MDNVSDINRNSHGNHAKSDVFSKSDLLIRSVGMILFGGGLTLYCYSRAHMKKFGGVPAHAAIQPNLITNGIFRYSRNPMYLGSIMFFIGGAVLRPMLAPLGCLCIIHAHYMTKREEKILKERFGEEYDAYQQRVPRYLGYSKKI
eukprot:525241_1